MTRAARLLLMAGGAAALLAGLLAGMQRMGWFAAVHSGDLMLLHGPLMIAGFFGTLIGVERAVGQGLAWLNLAPAFSGAAGLLIVAGEATAAVSWLFTAASLVLLSGGVALVRVHPALFTVTMAAGTAAWLVGNLAWLADGLSPTVVLWWAGFLVLVIAGERLELSRVLRHGRGAQVLFLVGAGLFVAGLASMLVEDVSGLRLAAAGLMALAAWLVRFDIARRTLKGQGLTRYMAICLLAGYGWLAAGGIVGMSVADPFGAFAYDAMLHAVFVGFVFSMVFAHAPVILPAVARIAVPWRPAFFAPLVLLHGSLLLRLVADLTAAERLRQLAGLANAGSIVLFILLIAGSAAAASLRTRRLSGREIA